MKTNKIIPPYSILLLALSIAFVLHSCANRGYPEGGPKDETPPKVIAEIPTSYSTDFNKKRIEIFFNEFVQLKEVDQKFIISPPQNKKPKVRLKGKYIQIEFVDTLRPNMTYSLDFADAIVDNNESNPLGFYRYVFSTGKTIDSLELSGHVVHAESNLPMLNTYVFLYTENVDSIPVLKIPDYIARTDSSGFFRLTNLREADYKVVAVKDENRDFKFTPEGEMIGYIDSLVRPIVQNMSKLDTITRIEKIIGSDTLVSDSIVRKDYIAYGPSNLYIRLFEEKSTQLYLVDESRKERKKLDYIFSIPADHQFSIRLLNNPAKEGWFLTERNAGNDTLTLWIQDSLVYQQDTLLAELKYLRTDSTGQRLIQTDTTRYTFTDKKVKERHSRDRDQAPKEKIEFVSITDNLNSSIDIKSLIQLTFSEPILTEGLDSIKLFEVVDSIQTPIKFTLEQDRLKLRNFTLNANLQPGMNYKLLIDSASLFNIYGNHNNKLEKTFKVKEEREYGKLILNTIHVSCPTLLQLYKAENTKAEDGKVKFSIVQEKYITADSQVVFEHLKAGKFKIRAIQDSNENRLWDTGIYLKKQKPEEIIYFPLELNIKENFDVEQDFDLTAKNI